MQELQAYIDQVFENDENYPIFGPLIVGELKSNQK
jgi:hypothetical protein